VTYGTPGTLAAKQATTTVPIVMIVSGDAIATGIVTRTYLKIAEGCRSAISVE
jgi:hypothetical protein